MSDERSPEHHTRPPGQSIPLSHSPDAEKWQLERPLPPDPKFVDRQFEMWRAPVYEDIVDAILTETSDDPALRPGHSALARRWESHLADLANDDSLDDEDLEGDPYEEAFRNAYNLAEGDPRRTEAVKKLERLYKHRNARMTPEQRLKQQYETPPNALSLVMGLIFPVELFPIVPEI